MTQRLICTKDLVGMRVWIEKPKKKDPDAAKKMGKVRACVFHPQEKRCVGFIVKRPDLALMFRRKDLFVAYNGYELLDGAVLVHDDPAATDKGACNALGVNWDECVLWVGLPVMCQDGTAFGLVGSITYDADTGAIVTLDVTQGATANALLGMRHVPADLIRGFRYGMGAELSVSDQEGGEDVVRGAILVDDAVKSLPVEGGLAEKAGEATAVAGDKARAAVDAAKPKIDEAKAAAGEAATKGAYATGRQLKRATHMFSDFKDEFARASGKAGAPGEDDETVSLSSSSGEVAAIASKADEDVDYVFVDEDGNEVVFVDEDGNVISDPSLIDEEFDFADDVVIEAGKPAGAGAAAAGSRASAGA
ncbi:hypothetical protein, partial [Adlercreutzia sp. ZJ473]|uniref:hypothetical protein n=1 Tax=Adlercreutzia sp. ZJ473 TaxID=2722822 RepID=UPI001555CE09